MPPLFFCKACGAVAVVEAAVGGVPVTELAPTATLRRCQALRISMLDGRPVRCGGDLRLIAPLHP